MMLSIMVSLITCSLFGYSLHEYLLTHNALWGWGAGIAAFVFVTYWAAKFGGLELLGNILEGIGDIFS